MKKYNIKRIVIVLSSGILYGSVNYGMNPSETDQLSISLNNNMEIKENVDKIKKKKVNVSSFLKNEYKEYIVLCCLNFCDRGEEKENIVLAEKEGLGEMKDP